MDQSAEYLVEQLTPDFGFYLRSARRLVDVRSRYQRIEVFDNALFGRAMRIDGCFMTSERDEFFYHESMVHVPAIAHPGPRSALVVGGGDGGAVEELLKHACMQRVVMAELDSDVVSIAREHLSSIHNGAFDDPRLELVIGDGRKYVENCSERFDQVVLDLTDPFGPAQALYTEAFYAACRRILHPGGLLSLHMQSPVTHPRAFSRIFSSVRSAFSVVRPMLVYVPLYGTWWALAVAAESTDPLDLDEAEVERRIGARGLARLRFYNGAMHRAVMALPNFVRGILAQPEPPVSEGEPLDDVPDPASLPALSLLPAQAAKH
jgi:spermidine synthase